MGQLHLFQKEKPIIDKQIKDQPIILVGHQMQVICLIVIKHNKLASSSEDTTIKIWSLVTNQCLTTLRGHKRQVRSLIELKDNRIASGSDDYFIKLWCPKSFQCTATLTGHIDRVLCLTQINNDLIASYANNSCIKVWDISINKCIKTICDDFLSSSIIALQNERLVYATLGFIIVLCNTTTFKDPILLKSAMRSYHCCFAELNDNRLFYGNINCFEVWNILLGQCIYQIFEDNSYGIFGKEIRILIKMNNGILVASNGICVKLWNIDDYQCIKTTYLESNCLVELEDGRIASAAKDKTIQLVNI